MLNFQPRWLTLPKQILMGENITQHPCRRIQSRLQNINGIEALGAHGAFYGWPLNVKFSFLSVHRKFAAVVF